MARARTLALLASLLALTPVALASCDDDPPLDDPNLEWEPCDHGREFVDGVCVGTSDLATWTAATDGCAAMIAEEPGTRWRLPTPEELSAFIRADSTIDPARRWSNARSDDPETKEQPLAIDHGGYPVEQEPGKRIRYRCVKG